MDGINKASVISTYILLRSNSYEQTNSVQLLQLHYYVNV